MRTPEGCIFHLYGEQKKRIEPKFVLVIDVTDIIMPFKFGDDGFRRFGLTEGQILHFFVVSVVLTTLALLCEVR